MRLLLASRASVSTRDADGQTPLHKAAIGGSAAVVRLLLDTPGADPCLADKRGATPLDLAHRSAVPEAAELLAAAEAAIGAKEMQTAPG